MSIVESALDAAKNPANRDLSEEWNRSKSELTRSFLSSEISLREYRERQSLLGIPDWVITLPYPGPLYGLLRKLGLDKESTKKITYEERAHYDVARNNGIYDKVHIEFTDKECESPEKNTSCGEMNVFISYSIPQDRDPSEVRKIIRDILLAPSKPSSDDLAKLPYNDS